MSENGGGDTVVAVMAMASTAAVAVMVTALQNNIVW